MSSFGKSIGNDKSTFGKNILSGITSTIGKFLQSENAQKIKDIAKNILEGFSDIPLEIPGQKLAKRGSEFLGKLNLKDIGQKIEKSTPIIEKIESIGKNIPSLKTKLTPNIEFSPLNLLNPLQFTR